MWDQGYFFLKEKIQDRLKGCEKLVISKENDVCVC